MKRFVVACSFLVAALLAGCSDSDRHGSPPPPEGQVTMHVTDAPPDLESLSKVELTVDRVSVHQEAEASSGFLTVFEGARTFDLLQLRGGVTSTLLTAALPAGTYHQVRLHVSRAEVVLEVGGVLTTFSTDNGLLELTSADTSGVKVHLANQPIEVVGGLSAELLFDFDVSRSLQVVGSPAEPTKLLLMPVIRGADLSTTGRIAGVVRSDSGTPGVPSDDVAIEAATASAFQGGVVVASTLTDEAGVYVLPGLPAGIYEVHFEAAGHLSAAVSDVQVAAGNQTTLDATLAR